MRHSFVLSIKYSGQHVFNKIPIQVMKLLYETLTYTECHQNFY